MENYLIKMEFYFEIIIYDYKPFSVQTNQRLIYLKIPLYFLIENNFYVCDRYYVKQIKEYNKKQKRKANFVWTLALCIFEKYK
jgi:hypothetical protein